LHPLKKQFIDLVTASGLSQADIARLINMTRGGVNGIVTGESVPSIATVQLLKLALLAEKPEILRPSGKGFRDAASAESYNPDGWANDLLNELRQIEEKDRDTLVLALRAVVRAWPRRRSAKY
jgi:transcriptional regulator with XRE-family HTH domain